ncbi:MAG: 4-(cytidine 5'-diphospho)-2-C-methyl-D-erythritol kinase [Methylocystis sp.]|nr:4-(cytidine 5'-diphospho)-2-C-methyl-D-erythritol kinase [Methylocystis sp.]
MLTTRAPAKINLTLHVLGRRSDDGYHELESLVAFTGCGDLLTLAPGGELALSVEGPTAAAAGSPADNLVLRAARNLAERVSGLRLGAFRLTKLLPVAAGIGGGSSDAAAALRLLARANDLALDDARLQAAARAAGADVPVCLSPRARMMRGAGETLGGELALPPLPAVLVNPGVAVATSAAFARLRLAPGERTNFGPHPNIAPAMMPEALWSALRMGRNDMERSACIDAPVVVDVLAALAAAEGCKLARMSGSGATCFALFATRRAASRAAALIRGRRPSWWVKAAVLR